MSINDRTSETALATLSLRDLSNYESDGKVKTHDTLAEIFLFDIQIILVGYKDDSACLWR